MAVILQAQSITKAYGDERILKGISLEIYENAFCVILGPSGSGKSTFLNVLSGLIRPTSGRVIFDGKPVSSYTQTQLADWKRADVGHIFQNYLLLSNLTAAENIRIGITPDKQPLSFDMLIDMLELGPILNKFPAQLSGGQQQRVAIARAVIKNPRLLFCDEATGSLDEANSKKVVELLHSICASFGTTVLFTTHNAQIAQTAHRVLTIKDGLLHKDITNEAPIAAGDMVWGE